MKKKIVAIVVFMLFLTACGSGDVIGDADTPKKEPENKEVVEKEPVEEAIEEEFATRKNPASFEESVYAIGEYLGTPIEYKVTLSNLIRGEEAEELALSINQFNEWSEDEEPIFFDADFDLIKYEPEDDDPYWVSSYSFDVFKSSYSEYRGSSLVVDNEFSGEVYEGGNVTGIVGIVIPKGDQSLLVFEDTFWFQLP